MSASSGVVGHDHAALAGRHLLVRVEGEGPRAPERPDRPASQGRADRLAGVVDQQQAVSVGDLLDRVPVGRVPEHVDDHDGLRPIGDPSLEVGGVEVVRVGLDVDEDRRGPLEEEGVGARRERERRHQDLVARTDAERLDDQVQRRGARGDRDPVLDAGDLRCRALEPLGERTEPQHP